MRNINSCLAIINHDLKLTFLDTIYRLFYFKKPMWVMNRQELAVKVSFESTTAE